MTDGRSGVDRMTKNQRRDAAREKAKALRDQQRKKERRNRFLLQGGLILGTLAIVAIVTLVIVNSMRPPGPGPRNMLSDGIVIGADFAAEETAALKADQKPVATSTSPDVIAIQVWVDYLCPRCGEFEQANSEQISTLVESGAATLEIHPVAILDRASSGSKYSTRAANAAACVADKSPDSFYGFSALLFENQPAENTTGLTDTELIGLTEEAGVSSASEVETCITDQAFKRWVGNATDRATDDEALADPALGSFGTPTVFVNGARYTGAPTDAGAFAQFIAEADGEAFAGQSPSPSPSPSVPPPPAP